MLRVVGTDPGTSSLDLLLLGDGAVIDQVRLEPARFREDPEVLTNLLARWSPIDLVAAPSGYGLPLVRGEDFTDDHLEQMSLVRPDERGRDSGVIGFRSWVRAFVRSGAPLVFLPGGFHLPTIPAYRKAGAVDFGTADKVAVAALALWFDATATGDFAHSTFAVVEVGSAFTAILVVHWGQIVNASAGTRGPLGLRSGGAWDGEVAYWRGPLAKDDLFRGGLADLGAIGPAAYRESIYKHATALQAVTPFEQVYLSGRGLEQPEMIRLTAERAGPVRPHQPAADPPGRVGQACRAGLGHPRRRPGRRPVRPGGRVAPAQVGLGIGLGCPRTSRDMTLHSGDGRPGS